MRLVDANEIEDKLGISDEDIYFKYLLSECPTVEATPVVHGRWSDAIDIDTGVLIGFRCSACDVTWDYMTGYCPRCGALMDEEEAPHEH